MPINGHICNFNHLFDHRAIFFGLNRKKGHKSLPFLLFFLQLSSCATFSLSAILKMISIYHSPQTAQFAVSSRNISHDTTMKSHSRTRISFGMKTGMNSFRNDLSGDEISSRYHVNRYREIIIRRWNELIPE